MTCLFANDVNFDQFLSVINSCPFPENAVIMSFSPAQAVFEKYEYNEKDLLLTHEGRIFSEDGELKWRRIDNMIRMVYLGSHHPIEILNDHSEKLSQTTSKRFDLILWGKRTDLKNEWIEQQVPHRFYKYPVDSNAFEQGRVAIEVERFMDNAGKAVFSRFCRVKEIKGEKNAS
jgi:hypothetical protein